MIASTAIIHKNVKLGSNVVIEDFCIIGAALSDGSHPETIIGDGARIRSHTVIYAGNRIGKNFQTGNKANIREFNVIGDNVSIGTLSVIEHHISIEDNVRIHSSVFIPEYSCLKQDSWVGPHAVFTNSKIPKAKDAKQKLHGPVLEPGAIVGANATISPGVSIGAHSLIGSGSNVTKDIPEGQIAFGNPAVVITRKI